MEFICERCKEEQRIGDDRANAPSGKPKKYTYVLRSGRTLKVVVDDESEFIATASSTPWFLLKMEDEPESWLSP